MDDPEKEASTSSETGDENKDYRDHLDNAIDNAWENAAVGFINFDTNVYAPFFTAMEKSFNYLAHQWDACPCAQAQASAHPWAKSLPYARTRTGRLNLARELARAHLQAYTMASSVDWKDALETAKETWAQAYAQAPIWYPEPNHGPPVPNPIRATACGPTAPTQVLSSRPSSIRDPVSSIRDPVHTLGMVWNPILAPAPSAQVWNPILARAQAWNPILAPAPNAQANCN
ncbi:hypothetical protein AMTR_s00006p00261290 [Amborella trichopoda]|uniref:Uncharacterized protein n=1 Tax=Amborella trichopoda TaxID=13333 RepID=W1PD06_AMBTC|nr:hypothetical protein AMTR_s00006p00261290 [Amborella trichopoda]